LVERRVYGLISVICMIFLLLFALFPVYYLIVSSLKNSVELNSLHQTLWPHQFTLVNYAKGFANENLYRALSNSLIVSLATTVVAVAVGSLAAMGLARFFFKGRSFLLNGILVSQLFPIIVLLVPLFVVWYQLHLYNTRISLVITYLALTLPLSVWLLVGYFSRIPVDIEEQALIDGCNRFQSLTRILLPLSLPGIASTSIYVFIQAWGEYIIALIMTSSDRARTLPVFLALQIGQHSTDWGLVLAIAVISLLPTLILFYFIQRFYASSLTSGAVKG